MKVPDEKFEELVSPVTQKKGRIGNGQAGSENIQESQMLTQTSYPVETPEYEEKQNGRGEWNSLQHDGVVSDEVNARGEGRGDEMYSKRSHEDDGKLQLENPRNGQIGYQQETWCEGVQSGNNRLCNKSSSQSDGMPVEVLPVALKNQIQYEDEMEDEEQSGEETLYENEEKSGIEESDKRKMPGIHDHESETLVEESDEEDSQESDDFALAENLLS